MCGISGFVDFNKKSTENILVAMKNSLSHRGPDDSGTFFSEQPNYNIGLGHNRLSILDLSEQGHQPMVVDNLRIVFNGEIYNFIEIKNDLLKDGITFKSNTDTEVILRSFQKWGISCLQYFRGMFSFVLYDEIQQKLWIVRDRVGVKPLYFYYHNNLFLFASELKAFHQHPGFVKEINAGSLALFLQYSYIPGPNCIFKNTFKLEPGHFIEFSLSERLIKPTPYWSVIDSYNKPKLRISESDAINQTEQILKESFNYRMVSDVPVGLFLSGGFDSSAVAALLQTDRTERLKTFTIGFDVSGFDEAPDARKIAEYLGTDHTEYYCTPDDALAIIPKLPEIYDEPFADNSSVPTVLVSQLARKNVTVALSGDGGDEIFGGYHKFNQSLKMSRGAPSLRTVGASIMDAINPDYIPILKNQYNFSTRYEKIKQILRSKHPAEILNVISSYIPETEVESLISGKYEQLKTNFESYKQVTNSDYLSQLLAVDYITFLVDNNLTKMDRATMSVALEGREPFLDQHVIEFVAQLPSSFKIRNGVTKSILKEVVYRHIPRHLMDRPKKPFIAPLSVWFLDRLKDFFIEYLNDKRLKSEGHLNFEPILTMRDQFLSGKNINHQKLWNILVFEMWYEKWMK
ncbi:MAG: asparagine synthase (glutamine-hydrolyzing) [Cyclobacteriaceae bacterium]|nr:asparagine synthase (glutamine-hydrolyzing) [Cyclobacteriaceae bacterium]